MFFQAPVRIASACSWLHVRTLFLLVSICWERDGENSNKILLAIVTFVTCVLASGFGAEKAVAIDGNKSLSILCLLGTEGEKKGKGGRREGKGREGYWQASFSRAGVTAMDFLPFFF